MGDPEKVYQSLVDHVQKGLEPVTMDQVAWVTDSVSLRDEMEQNRNQNSSITPEELMGMDVMASWLPLLSKDEQQKYQGYLEKLNLDKVPPNERPVRGVAVSQDPEEYCMWGSPKALPSFTKESTKRIMLTHMDRWLTSQEKAALTGFPCHKDSLNAGEFFIVSSFSNRRYCSECSEKARFQIEDWCRKCSKTSIQIEDMVWNHVWPC